MKIYIIRHANSVPRDGMNFGEASKVVLSSKGKEQARALVQRIKKLNFYKLYASPIERTKETALYISKEKNLPIIFDDRLKEHMPSFSATGSDYKSVRARTRREFDFKAADGESFNECAKRFSDFIDEITKESNESVCIVSHALVAEAFLTKRFNLKKIPRIDETSITLLESKNGKLELKYKNRMPVTLRRILRAFARRLKIN